MKTRQNAQRMKSLLARRERHGWSWAELSERSGLPVWRLRWWQKRLSDELSPPAPAGSFAPVRIVESSPSRPSHIEILTPSGFRIVVPDSFDPSHLQRLIQALDGSC